MAKTKISKKQETSSIEDMPIVKLKKEVKTTKYEPKIFVSDIDVKDLLKKAGISDSAQTACFSFFILYSRFEYALKRSGYLQTHKTNLFIDLDRASNELASNCDSQIKKLRETELKIFNAPPKKQINVDNTFEWADSDTSSMSETRRALHLASSVRNNLFHGGKWPHNPSYDLARDKQLIEDATKIIETIIDADKDLKQKFFDFP